MQRTTTTPTRRSPAGCRATMGLAVLVLNGAAAVGQNPVAEAARHVPIRVETLLPDMVFGVQDGNQEILLRVSGTELTGATLGGEPLPPERLVRQQDRWFILDANGGVAADLVVAGGQGRLRTHSDRHRVTVGMTVNSPTPDKLLLYELDRRQALEVVAVREGGPAVGAGLRPGDLLLAVGGRQPVTRTVLREAIADCRAGQGFDVDVLRRGGERQRFHVTVERDFDYYARADGPEVPFARSGSLLQGFGEPVVLVPANDDALAQKVESIERRMERVEQLLIQLVRQSAAAPQAPPRSPSDK